MMTPSSHRVTRGLAGIACLSLLGATLTACDLWTTAGGLDIETTTPAPSVTLAPAPAPAPSTDTTSGSPSPSPTRSPTGNNVEAVEEYALHDGVFTFSADGSRTAEFTPPSGYYFSSNDNPQGGMAVAPDDPYCNYVFRRDDVFVDQIPSSQEMTDLLISGGYTDSTTTDVTKLGEFPAAATDILRYGDGDYRGRIYIVAVDGVQWNITINAPDEETLNSMVEQLNGLKFSD
ncbi:hypothetical protein [Actinobaculum sp. 352]|uniref:hypothetical protein n=1 Tax=Actinobaculum sp. 352 TaxID=2490946 RepID=UPI000F7EE364|nr:hypothetical protein [Actinobaculum sp. 352]RTE50317.1 hypothetical protein EKN07_03695 [Actinobaculum sp. 352]